jgi:hypothetical protein
MTPAREEDLLVKIARLTGLAEAQGFRDQLVVQGECTGTVHVRLTQRMDLLRRREVRG